MPPQEDLYAAIVARRSVRRYEKSPLDEVTLAQIQEIIRGVKPLVSSHCFQVILRNTAEGEDLAAALGAYGRIVTPPHYLLPYMVGQGHLLEDLGFRVEQIVVRLTMMGLGSCYIGNLRREDKVQEHFALPEGARSGALLVFGWPSASIAGRIVNHAMHAMAGAAAKLPAERIFFQDSFNHPSTPPADLLPLIEAARHGPSAVNAQPWRFLWREGILHLFVKRRNLRYGPGAGTEYRLYDGGICMANVALALEALGREEQWVLYEGTEAGIPAHPDGLQPLAKLA